jgi:hypothetical protein
MPIIARPTYRRVSQHEYIRSQADHLLRQARERGGHGHSGTTAEVAASRAQAREITIRLRGKEAELPPCNPFAKGTWNVTEQAMLIKRDRTLAQALAGVCGQSIS